MSRTLALITGASSGIGVAYARELATTSDCDFVLVARRVDRLEALATELRAAGAAVEVLPADLGSPDGLDAVTGRLAAGDVRLLINCAGAGGFAPLVGLDRARIDSALTLNALTPIHLTRAALPGMLAAGKGTVINVASLLAFSSGEYGLAMPRTLYAAAKAATVAFTRALVPELEGTGVHALVVCPGVVSTEFHGDHGGEYPFAMSAEGVAQASLAALRLGENVCVPGLENQTAALDALLAAESALMRGGNQPVPAARYLAMHAA